jgi:hypothetical protein
MIRKFMIAAASAAVLRSRRRLSHSDVVTADRTMRSQGGFLDRDLYVSCDNVADGMG